MRVFLDRLYLFSGYLAGAFMLAIFVLMMVLSAGRPIGLNIPAADDFVSWCMAAMAFLGLAHTFRSGEMIRVGLLIDKLPDKSRHYVEIVCLIVGIGFIVVLIATMIVMILAMRAWLSVAPTAQQIMNPSLAAAGKQRRSLAGSPSAGAST